MQLIHLVNDTPCFLFGTVQCTCILCLLAEFRASLSYTYESDVISSFEWNTLKFPNFQLPVTAA